MEKHETLQNRLFQTLKDRPNPSDENIQITLALQAGDCTGKPAMAIQIARGLASGITRCNLTILNFRPL